MKVIDVAAGSDEWRMARLGIPTASQAHRIITPKGAPSAQRDAYLHELIAERLLGCPVDSSVPSDFMARGNELELEAVKLYELQTDTDTSPGGFCTTDDGAAGCSPDRLVGADGGLEIKCPKPATHVGYMLHGGHEDKYTLQVQMSLWVTGREWWDIMSYHPSLPPARLRIYRHETLLRLLGDRLRDFCEDLAEQSAKALALCGAP